MRFDGLLDIEEPCRAHKGVEQPWFPKAEMLRCRFGPRRHVSRNRRVHPTDERSVGSGRGRDSASTARTHNSQEFRSSALGSAKYISARPQRTVSTAPWRM